jgi:hypothetical protein
MHPALRRLLTGPASGPFGPERLLEDAFGQALEEAYGGARGGPGRRSRAPGGVVLEGCLPKRG